MIVSISEGAGTPFSPVGRRVRSATESALLAVQASLGRAALPFVATVPLGCGREAPDRANTVQLPLLLLILATAALAFALRRHPREVRVAVFVLQLGLYVFYETGVSIHTNIRVDLLLIYPAILTAAIALRGSAGPPRTTQ